LQKKCNGRKVISVQREMYTVNVVVAIADGCLSFSRTEFYDYKKV